MAKNNLDLIPIFQAVTQALTANQQSLNQADGYNQNHGTNMVQTFHTITNALEQKQGKTAGTGLSYAARQLAKNTTSTSGQLYAQNLSQAATQLKGKKVDAQTALSLLQMLIGSGTGSSANHFFARSESRSGQIHHRRKAVMFWAHCSEALQDPADQPHPNLRPPEVIFSAHYWVV